MTNKEAIKICIREKEYTQHCFDNAIEGKGYVSPDGLIRAADYVEALSLAIRALENEEE